MNPELSGDEDILSKSGPEESDLNPGQPLNDALSLRENEVELDYEAEEDDQDVSKEEVELELPKEQVCFMSLAFSHVNSNSAVTI